jgi:hypothetical protein
MMETAAFVVGHLGVLVGLTLVARVFGGAVFPTLTASSRLERWALAGTLGLGALGQIALLLGLLGLLRRAPISLLTSIAFVGWLRFRPRSALGIYERGHAERHGVAAVVIAVALAPLFFATLYPPTAFDETLYHLPTARAFAESGRLPFLADLRVPVFPQLGELLMAAVLLWSDDVATHLIAFLATLLTAMILVAWGRRLGHPLAGVGAAALFLGHPAVVYLAGTGYIDPELALFATGAMFAADRWRHERQPAWLVGAAFLAGCAASTKYLGLFFVVGVALGVVLYAPPRRRSRALALLLLVSAATAGPSYARIVYWTGNPLFPFLPEVFGQSAWASFDPTATERWSRLGAALTLPWDLVFRREVAGQIAPYSPAYLLGLPVLIAGAWMATWVRGALLVCGAYLIVVPANARYALAVAPLASLALALSWVVVVGRFERRVPSARALASALGVAVFLPGWCYAGYALYRGGSLPVTSPTRETYLSARLPAYQAIRFLNVTRGDRYVAYQLGAEQMRYYARGRLLGEHTGPTQYAALLGGPPDPERLLRILRGWGADHLVITRAARHLLPGDPGTWRGVRLVYADGHAEVFELTADLATEATTRAVRGDDRETSGRRSLQRTALRTAV